MRADRSVGTGHTLRFRLFEVTTCLKAPYNTLEEWPEHRMGSKYTRIQLQNVTDFLAFERLCNAVMIRYFSDIEPMGGYKDKGRDALHYSASKGIHTIFQYSAREDWEKKLKEDLEKIKTHGHPCDQVVFITNREVGAGDRDRVMHLTKDLYGWRLRLCSLEKLATMIDDRGEELKRHYPEIFFMPADNERPFQSLDLPAYMKQVVDDYVTWEQQYTSLFIDRFEFDLHYARSDGPDLTPTISATDIPALSKISVLLGESGAGKTTTLRRLALAAAQHTLRDGTNAVPILIPLRAWSESSDVFQLVVHQFAAQAGHPAAVEALLHTGNVLLLLDGVNELPALPMPRTAAGSDLRSFLTRFPNIRVVMTCRTADYQQEFVDPGIGDPPRAYETQRLLQSQIQDYVRRTLPPEQAEQFLEGLGVSAETVWADTTSILQLARIPFHLRLMLSDFASTGELPSTSLELVQRLLRRICQARPGQRAPTVDVRRKTQLLAQVAGASLQSGGNLVMPAVAARDAIDATVTYLHGEHLVDSQVSADAVWADLMSENLLHHIRHAANGVTTRGHDQVEWLHQLFRDYFLGEFLVSLSFDPAEPRLRHVKMTLRLAPAATIQACLISLALAPSLTRKRVLFDEFRAFGDLRHALFTQLHRDEIEAMLLDGVDALMDGTVVQEEELKRAALYFYSPRLPEVLLANFKGQLPETKRAIAATLSEYVITFHRKGNVRRAIQGFQAMVGSHDDQLRFHAAKALWETDRGLAARTLESLAESEGALASQARELLQLWQPE